jgi:carbon monoxide dehydrogenase subunit G
VDVTGEVYRLADPTLNTPTVTLLARVGDAVPSANLSVTNNSPDQYTEALKVDIGPVSAGFSGSGAIAALAAQATDAASLSVSLASTATSQNINGTAELDFQSTGAGTTGEADVSVGSAFVSLAGKVYEKAVALVQQVVDFGIVHVGELVAALGVSVTNDAPGAALNDTLTGSIAARAGRSLPRATWAPACWRASPTPPAWASSWIPALRASSPELPRPACSATTRTWRISRWAVSRLT